MRWAKKKVSKFLIKFLIYFVSLVFEYCEIYKDDIDFSDSAKNKILNNSQITILSQFLVPKSTGKKLLFWKKKPGIKNFQLEEKAFYARSIFTN